MKRTKSQTYILETLKKYGECHVGWSYSFGQRLRDAAYALQDEGLVRVTDVRTLKNFRKSAIVVATSRAIAKATGAA